MTEAEVPPVVPVADAYTQLIAFLAERAVPFQLIDHAPEGRTELVSALRGHPASDAAKCMILMVKQGKKVTRYVLAVVPGDSRVDMAAVKALLSATYVSFAEPRVAEGLAGTPTGTVLPFSFNPALELIVDPSLLDREKIYFNAGRLDRSMVLETAQYAAVAKPRLARIAGEHAR
jgi:Ala-tRNA(Pro) deacylase